MTIREENLQALRKLMDSVPEHTPAMFLKEPDDDLLRRYVDGDYKVLHPVKRWVPSNEKWIALDMRVYSLYSWASKFSMILIFYHTPEGRYGYVVVPKMVRPNDVELCYEQLVQVFGEGAMSSILSWVTDELGDWRKRVGRKTRIDPPEYWKDLTR